MTDEIQRLDDTAMRRALLDRLEARHVHDAGTAILEELGLCQGQVRVDVAVVNGQLHGYEIKSDRDSLRRLAGQVEIYNKVLDRATLVVGMRHEADALAIVPSWWGVLRIEPRRRGFHVRVLRRERRNPARDARAIVQLLWLAEARALLEKHGAARGVRSKSRRLVWDRLCDHLSVEEIAAAVRMQLRFRAAPPDPRLPA